MVNKTDLESLALRDPLSFGILHIDLLDDKHWKVWKWLPELYSVGNPWAIEKYPVGLARKFAIQKSTQAGITTLMMVKSLHFLANWNVRVFYTLPRLTDVGDFSGTRLDPTIQASPFLRELLGEPNSNHAKRIGNSYMYISELTTEPRMLPSDMAIIDEVDLSDIDHMSTVLNRLDASRWKLSNTLSTPTLANYGINAIFLNSDMREWMVKCPSCGTHQVMDFDVNVRIEGPPDTPTRVYYGCEKCDREFTVDEINEYGEWVPGKPQLSDEHRGYHISQMMTHPAIELYKAFRDPQTKLVEFYRKRLGMPYQLGGGSIEREDFLVTCFDDPYLPEMSPDDRSKYYMGLDQGNELQVVIGKIEPDSRLRKIVHIEFIPMEDGFERAAKLMKLFRIKRAVWDGNPNRHPVLTIQKNFPGKLLAADYIEQQKTRWKTNKQGQKYTTNVTIHRTTMFDELMESIKKGEWQLYGEPPSLNPEVELLIDHVTALKRDVEERTTRSGTIEVGVYRKLRMDHLAHAMGYLGIAMDIDKGKRGKVAVVGEMSAEEIVVEEDSERPPKEDIVYIVGKLAEVPKEQLSEYLLRRDSPKYEIPFPLSYKITKVSEYDQNVVDWVITEILLGDGVI